MPLKIKKFETTKKALDFIDKIAPTDAKKRELKIALHSRLLKVKRNGFHVSEWSVTYKRKKRHGV